MLRVLGADDDVVDAFTSLLADAPAGELRDMDAIYVIALFIVVIGALNRIEFGRFD